jgi:hypothetical protein
MGEEEGLAVSRNSDRPVEVRLVDISLEGDVFGVSKELHFTTDMGKGGGRREEEGGRGRRKEEEDWR